MYPAVRTTVIIFAFVFAGSFLLSQNPASSKAALLQEYAQADQAYQKAVEISNANRASEEEEDKANQIALKGFSVLDKKLNQSVVPFDSLRFFTAFKIGELQHYFSHEKEAIQFYDIAMAAHKHTGLADSLLFKPYLFKGIILYNQNKFDSARFYFEAAEKVQLQYRQPLSENQRLYNSLGAMYFATGNYNSAKIYFQKALDVLPKSNPYYKELLVNYSINQAASHVMLEEYNEANEIYQKLIPYGLNLNEIYHNLGVINQNLGAPQKALLFFRKVNYQGNGMVRLYNDIGYAYFNAKQVDSANYYYEKALEANTRLSENMPNVAHGITLDDLGKLSMAARQPDSSLHFFQAAIHQFYPAYQNDTVTANPQNFSGAFSYINLFTVLVDKASALADKYKITGKREWLEAELETFEAAFRLVDYVEKTYNSDEARLFLGKIKYSIHSKPIDVAYALYQLTNDQQYIERAYVLDQRNKASVLAYNIHFNNVNHTSPALQEERNLRTEITRLSLKAMHLSDAAERETMNRDIRNNEMALGKLQENQSKTNPSAAVSILPIRDLQNQLLDDNTALLSFHLSDSFLTVFQVTAKSFVCQRKQLPPDFRSELAALKASLDSNGKEEFSDQSNQQLYDFLIGDVAEERLIIVPEDELNALPFETLKDRKGHYLVETHAVAYQYSTALLKKESFDFSNAQTLAFAPFAGASYVDGPLHFSQLKNSTAEFEGPNTKPLINGQATKQAFLNGLTKPAILHFATHAAVNKDNNDLSFIAFWPQNAKGKTDYLLYAKEIADLSLPNTKLVILSACESGSGNLVKGEGLMSLSRAFAYAGCPNTITSIWKADDASTSYIVKRIHGYLEEGQPIDRAVQQAKKDYLADDRINPRLKIPSYWSHLIFIGNYTPEGGSKTKWLIIGGLLFVVLVFFLFRRIFRS